MRLTILIAAFMIIVGEPAMAFECTDQSLPSRFVICSDPELTRLAEARQRAFDETISRLDPQQRRELLADQQGWVASYSLACGISARVPPPNPIPTAVIACFKRAAEARLAYIRAYGTLDAAGDEAQRPLRKAPTAAENVVVSPKIGPSFDCNEATQPIGKMICSDQALSRLDLQFVQAYQALRYQLDDAGQVLLRRDAVEFHKATLLECGIPESGPTTGSIECVRKAYQEQRLNWLSRLMGPAREEANRAIEQHLTLQRALQRLKYLADNPDGVYGSNTRVAIAEFERAHGQPVTGFLSDADARLLNEQTTVDEGRSGEVPVQDDHLSSSANSETAPAASSATEGLGKEIRPGLSANNTQSAPDTPAQPPLAAAPQDAAKPPLNSAAEPRELLSSTDCKNLFEQAGIQMQWKGTASYWTERVTLLGRPINGYTADQIDNLISSAMRVCRTSLQGMPYVSFGIVIEFLKNARQAVIDLGQRASNAQMAREARAKLDEQVASDMTNPNIQCPAPTSCGDPLQHLTKPGRPLTAEESRALAEAMIHPLETPPDPAYSACLVRQKVCIARARQEDAKKPPDLEKAAEGGDKAAMLMLVGAYAVPQLMELPLQPNCDRANYWAEKLERAPTGGEDEKNAYPRQVWIQTFLAACKTQQTK